MRVSNKTSEGSIEPGPLEKDNDQIEAQKSESDKDESKNLSTSEGSEETIVSVSAAHECCSGVGVDSNSHSNVTCSNGSTASNHESCGGVWEVGWLISNVHLLQIDCEPKQNGENSGKDTQIQILLSKERVSTLNRKSFFSQ